MHDSLHSLRLGYSVLFSLGGFGTLMLWLSLGTPNHDFEGLCLHLGRPGTILVGQAVVNVLVKLSAFVVSAGL